MRISRYSALTVLSAAVVAAALLVALAAPSGAQSTINFNKSVLQNENADRPTSMQFGPDGRLYVSTQNGFIRAYTVARNGQPQGPENPNPYSVAATETIGSVKAIPNHNDDGTLAPTETQRQVTGILVTGTAANPVIYASSSDPRIGGGNTREQGDLNLDTNSGILSRLTWDGSKWNKVDLVRGMPRSEENHAVNGMQLSPDGKKLYLAVGSNTNHGAPSNNFALLPEYALSAAILSIDLGAIGNTTYDLPTLDSDPCDHDPTDGVPHVDPDQHDPFGGCDGKNQAKIVPGGPVQVHASGFRNAYDVLIAKIGNKSGKMYTVDNSGNAGWGDVPVNEGPAGNCTNGQKEPGVTDRDTLHLVSGTGYYGGHPNPTRGNTANTFNESNPQSPVPVANPVECDYRAPGAEKGDLTNFGQSVNGLAEYTATNFDGAMRGDILAAGFNDDNIYRIKLNDAGTAVASQEILFSTAGIKPLDVTTQGDAGPFPGTIWTGNVGGGDISVFEPQDATGPPCPGTDDPALDDDSDGFDNADEIDNATNPCSAADQPADADGDKNSDLNDPDDDNDTLADTSDPFAVDEHNGKATNLPVSYTWDNEGSSSGGLLNLGFTGLMTNKTQNYKALYDSGNMTAGGAAGAVTVDKVPAGDSLGAANTQKYGFQFGVNATQGTGKFVARTRIVGPFAGVNPQDNQSMGIFLGNGDQDNYVKLVTNANGGAGGVRFQKEVAGALSSGRTAALAMPGPSAVNLFLAVDPAAGTVQPSYQVINNGVAGPRTNVGAPVAVPAGWFGGTTGLAVGIISTSSGPGPEFPATWDSIEVVPDVPPGNLPPEVQPPAQSLIGGQTLAPSTTPVKLKWSAADDGGAISRYELQQSVDGGAFTDVALSSATQTSITLKLDLGKTYRYQVRAQDGAGAWSGWEQGLRFTARALQESDGAIQYTGSWSTQSSSNASGGSLRYANAAGALAKLTSDSGLLNVAWVAPRGTDRGKAEAWVDGAMASTVDLYTSSAQSRRMVFVKNGTNPSQPHTLEVRVLGTKSASSSGTRVDVDAFVVLEAAPSP